MALNWLNITEEALTDENQLLCDCVEELERQVTILTGKKTNSIVPLQKIWSISLEITGDPVQENPHKLHSVNESTKRSDLEAPQELELFAI